MCGCLCVLVGAQGLCSNLGAFSVLIRALSFLVACLPPKMNVIQEAKGNVNLSWGRGLAAETIWPIQLQHTKCTVYTIATFSCRVAQTQMIEHGRSFACSLWGLRLFRLTQCRAPCLFFSDFPLRTNDGSGRRWWIGAGPCAVHP